MRIVRCLFVGAVFLLIAVHVAPVWAQVDFSGEWAPRFWEDQPERVPGPELGNYLGIPINEAARMRGDTWDAAIQPLPEWQCRPLHVEWGGVGLVIRRDHALRASHSTVLVSRRAVCGGSSRAHRLGA